MIDMLRPYGKRVVFKYGGVLSSGIFSVMILLVVICPFRSRAQGGEREVMILDGLPLAIEFKEAQKKVALEVASICRRWLPGLIEEIGLEDASDMKVVLLDRVDDYKRRTHLNLPKWGAAFALVEKQVILVDVKKAVSSWDALEKTVPHELSHLLLAQKVGNVPLPLWFVEGMAVWQAREWSLVDGWHLMNAVWGGRVMPLGTLAGAFPSDARTARVAYGVSYRAFLEIFSGASVEDTLKSFLDDIVRERNFDAAMVAFRGESTSSFARAFSSKLKQRYTSHLFLFQTGPLFSILAVLFLFVVLIVKLKSKRRLRELEKSEMGLSLDE